MACRLQFDGPWKYRAQSGALLLKAAADVCLRRSRKGPICKEWNLAAEIGTEVSRRQLAVAFEMPDVNKARSYLDAFAIDSTAISKVDKTDVTLENFRGSWLIPRGVVPAITMLFLHGGGYSFYPKKVYSNLAAMIALSARSRLFALDYRSLLS